MFTKHARIESLGFRSLSDKASFSRVASIFLEDNSTINIEAALDSVADVYKISRDPRDYLFVPARANSADRPNNNLDGWELEELQRYDPMIRKAVYKTYDLKPHFVNHNATALNLSRGVILDSHLNTQNPADEITKQAIFDASGKEVENDVFVELLIAVDTTKDPSLAAAYQNGSVDAFSMGCDVMATECSSCGNVATSDFDLCTHIRNKYARQPVECLDGKKRIAWEKCMGTVFQEISAVDDPADETALVQEGLLKAASTQDLQEIVNFVAKNASTLPDSVAVVLSDYLSQKG